jgi:hypothetical protein
MIDRSITYVSADIDDEEALTPSHLLNVGLDGGGGGGGGGGVWKSVNSNL